MNSTQLSYIPLGKIEVSGIASESALQGQMTKIWTRGGITSDDEKFHVVLDGIQGLINLALSKIDQPFSWDQVSSFALLISKDGEAKLFFNNIPIEAKFRLKVPIEAGQIVYETMVADVHRLRLGLEFDQDSKVFICLKCNWKFIVYFDLHREEFFSNDAMEKILGHLYRTVYFNEEFSALENEKSKTKLFQIGWFPFIEILGREFRSISRNIDSADILNHAESELINSFDEKRIKVLRARWLANPASSGKNAIFASGLEAFVRGDNIACIKILVTEIEGVARLFAFGQESRPTILMKAYILEKGSQKAESESTLYFPDHFSEYINNVFFAQFNLNNTSVHVASRHTVGHGVAADSLYTRTKALQVILTLDQVLFYLL